MRLSLLITCACITASAALAEKRAVVLGAQDYGGQAGATAAADISGAAKALEAAGFEVVSGVDLEIGALREVLGSLLGEEAPERSVILLTGRFAHSGGSGWYLPGEADAPSLATVDGRALSLDTVMEIAGRSPGGAVVLLGSPLRDAPEDASEDVTVALGVGLEQGIGTLDPPQGVTVITGEIPDILDFAGGHLVESGRSLPEMLEDAPELEAHGFLSRLVTFLVQDRPVAPDPTGEADEADEAAARERALWRESRETDTIKAYEAYLGEYPEGAFADEARAAIERFERDPERIEAALELRVAERQQIQRDLVLLDHDTRGVDGIFGPGSRSAIRRWQRDNGFEPTGFLTAVQIDTLSEMAATRRAAQEEEARQQDREREREDRAYWEDIGRGQDEAGLRAYLERFPDGAFSDVARARLSEIGAERDREAWERAEAQDTKAAYRRYLEGHEDGEFAGRARSRLSELVESDAKAADEAAWEEAREADSAQAYAQYLEDFPEGAFSKRARRRQAELTGSEATGDEAPSGAEAREAEAALGLNQISRSLVEAQLLAQGFNPGRSDGQFDDNTRAALRRYQEARGLPVTGYVDRRTLNRMIADGLPLPR
ncbi:MAG: peptidoglycan-binding domain-containing protein [Pseudomonadota bacterium]|uniref:peptidoglycan-binding domain-containing protein n=1 Tax=Roseovarius TaxID=74030 RepID=UPI0022A81F97|nr:peptidoglycan-binding domain-containing protein [Roseovarius sp. EGI FJ00037]MCZ0813957.1 peptidoglycan-binding domain-containing protein [Roseovarius sp. EGI FJ00037]